MKRRHGLFPILFILVFSADIIVSSTYINNERVKNVSLFGTENIVGNLSGTSNTVNQAQDTTNSNIGNSTSTGSNSSSTNSASNSTTSNTGSNSTSEGNGNTQTPSSSGGSSGTVTPNNGGSTDSNSGTSSQSSSSSSSSTSGSTGTAGSTSGQTSQAAGSSDSSYSSGSSTVSNKSTRTKKKNSSKNNTVNSTDSKINKNTEKANGDSAAEQKVDSTITNTVTEKPDDSETLNVKASIEKGDINLNDKAVLVKLSCDDSNFKELYYTWSQNKEVKHEETWIKYEQPLEFNKTGIWYLHYKAIDKNDKDTYGYFGPYNASYIYKSLSADNSGELLKKKIIGCTAIFVVVAGAAVYLIKTNKFNLRRNKVRNRGKR